jgi:hypothetical protein
VQAAVDAVRLFDQQVHGAAEADFDAARVHRVGVARAGGPRT